MRRITGLGDECVCLFVVIHSSILTPLLMCPSTCHSTFFSPFTNFPLTKLEGTLLAFVGKEKQSLGLCVACLPQCGHWGRFLLPRYFLLRFPVPLLLVPLPVLLPVAVPLLGGVVPVAFVAAIAAAITFVISFFMSNIEEEQQEVVIDTREIMSFGWLCLHLCESRV